MDLTTALRDYLEFCRYRKELDVKTLKAYRIDLRQMAEYLDGRECTRQNLEKYVTHLHKQFGKKTVKRKIASMKAFFSYLEEEEQIERNPFEKIKVRFQETLTLPRVIPRKSIEELLAFMYRELEQMGRRDCVREYGQVLRDIAVVEMLFATGARVCEIAGLRDKDVDTREGIVRIMGKGARERVVQVGSQEVLEIIQRYHEANQSAIASSSHFFVNRRGRAMSEQSIRNMLHSYQEKAHLPGNITPHMFRHSVATYLLEEDVDIAYIQKLLGHSSIKTTQIYIHVASKKQAELLKERHPRNKMSIR